MRRNRHYAQHQKALNLAGGGYVRVSDCQKCGHAIAWMTSKKTGKRYPCNVYPKQGSNYEDSLRVAPWTIHDQKVCQVNQDGEREWAEWDQQQQQQQGDGLVKP